MPRFVIEGGHAYNTAGKRLPDGSMREWEFNNAVAVWVEKKLLEYQNVSVLFVSDKSGKEDVSLKERADKANAWGADAYVSIHANAFSAKWNDANGIETYVYENPSAGSLELAEKVHSQLILATGRKDRGVKREDFYVLRETNMPAILVECGFMTNQEEAVLLKSVEYREKVAQAIVNGLVLQYKLQKKKPAVKVTVAPPPPPPAPAKKSEPANGIYRVYAGAFKEEDGAKARVKALKAAGFASYYTKEKE